MGKKISARKVTFTEKDKEKQKKQTRKLHCDRTAQA